MALALEQQQAPDAADVERCRAGDASGLSGIFERHALEVQRFVLRLGLGLDRAALDDALQETLLGFHRLAREGRYDPDRPLRPYLLGIARNVALATSRKGARGTALRVDVPAGSPDPVAVAATNERRQAVSASLAALHAADRAALVLRHEHGLTMEELAEALECSVPTARARLKAAARRFAAELGRRGILAREDA